MLNRLFFVLTGGLALAAIAVGGPIASAQTVPVQGQSAGLGISVVGSGVVLAQPDVARITVGADVFDQSLSAAQSEAARRMDAVIAKLKAGGIRDADIHTVSFSVNPQYDQSGQNQPVLRGYQVQNLIEIRTTSIAGLGSLLDDAVSAGATRIYGIRFEASNMEDLKSQARDQAMQNARTKADQLARDAGVSLGRPLTIEESDPTGVTPVRAQVAPAAAAPAAAATSIQPGELQVSTTVTVIWSIQ